MMDTQETLSRVAAALLLRAKAEVLRDVLDGRIPDPELITTYGDLHDHLDANYYGGAFDDDITNNLARLVPVPPSTKEEAEESPALVSQFGEVINQFYEPMQDAVNAWITSGNFIRRVADVATGKLPEVLVRAIATGLPVYGIAGVYL